MPFAPTNKFWRTSPQEPAMRRATPPNGRPSAVAADGERPVGRPLPCRPLPCRPLPCRPLPCRRSPVVPRHARPPFVPQHARRQILLPRLTVADRGLHRSDRGRLRPDVGTLGVQRRRTAGLRRRDGGHRPAEAERGRDERQHDGRPRPPSSFSHLVIEVTHVSLLVWKSLAALTGRLGQPGSVAIRLPPCAPR